MSPPFLHHLLSYDNPTVIKDEIDSSPYMLPTRIRQFKKKPKFERISRGSLDTILN